MGNSSVYILQVQELCCKRLHGWAIRQYTYYKCKYYVVRDCTDGQFVSIHITSAKLHVLIIFTCYHIIIHNPKPTVVLSLVKVTLVAATMCIVWTTKYLKISSFLSLSFLRHVPLNYVDALQYFKRQDVYLFITFCEDYKSWTCFAALLLQKVKFQYF